MSSFRKDFGIFSTGFLLILSLLLTVYTKHNPETVRLGSLVTSSILYPIQGSYNYIDENVSGLWDKYIDLINIKQESTNFKTENEKLKSELISLSEIAEENRKLKELLSIKTSGSTKSVVAKVIGYDPSTWIDQIIIDKGMLDNIQIGQVVISSSGLVGQVIMSGAKTAHIQLLSDRRSSVDSIVQRTRIRGIVDGNGSFSTKWNYVPNDSDIIPGDIILSSGLDGVFPEGLLIGSVLNVEKVKTGQLFKDVNLKLAVEYRQLEYVMVLVNE